MAEDSAEAEVKEADKKKAVDDKKKKKDKAAKDEKKVADEKKAEEGEDMKGEKKDDKKEKKDDKKEEGKKAKKVDIPEEQLEADKSAGKHFTDTHDRKNPIKQIKKWTAGFEDDPSDLDEHYTWETSWNASLTKIWSNQLFKKKETSSNYLITISNLVDKPIWVKPKQINEVIYIDWENTKKKNDIK